MAYIDEATERTSLLQRARKSSQSGVFAERKRVASIRVMYLTMFLSSVSFTMTMSSIWPFLHVLDHNATADFLGWVVATYSVGQLISSPLFGMWANWRGKSREPLAFSITMGVGANMMYAYLQSIDGDKRYLMIAARGLVGFASGNIAVVRSYVAGATTLSERTTVMANVGICQSVGFILGPVIQAAFVPLSYPGVIETKSFHLNMYTAPAIFAAILCFINIVLLFTRFQELVVQDENDQNGQNNSVENYKPDLCAVISCIPIFFVTLFLFTIFETIATPLSMDVFAWTKQQSTLYIGIILASCGVEAIGVSFVLKILSKRYKERYLLIGGFVLCFLGFFVLLPWGDGKIILAQSSYTTSENITTQGTHESTHMWSIKHDTFLHSGPDENHFNNESTVVGTFGHVTTTYTTPEETMSTFTVNKSSPEEPVGCPSTISWCYTTPPVYPAQFIIGYFVITVGYITAMIMIYTLYSKILGPKPQGLWMGWLSASGSLGRTLGPIFVSQIYYSSGPRVVFAAVCGIVLATILAIIAVFKKLVPCKFTSDCKTRLTHVVYRQENYPKLIESKENSVIDVR